MSDVTPPQAGWYADPENAAGERWWNGSGWSDHKRDATSAVPTPETPAPEPPAAVTPAPVETGFSFGSPAPADPRPDPYAAPPAVRAQPYYSAPASYAPAPYGAAAPRSNTNGLAIAGLAVSAAGWLVLGGLAAIAGIILSGFGLARARQLEAAGQPNSGRGIAMAGIIVGIAVLVIGIVLVVVYVAFLMSYGYAS
jgi:hypothetical protein